MIATLSARLQLALAVLAAGLVVLGVGAVLLLARSGRRQQEEDVARRLLRNSALPLLIQIGVRALDFGFIAVFYRLLPKDAVGDYDVAALLVSLYLGTIAEWGLGVLLTRELARDRQAIASTFGTALILRLGLAIVALPVAFLVIGGYQLFQSLGVITYGISTLGAALIAILTLTLLPSAIGSAVTSVFLAAERPIVPALVNLLNNVLSTALRLGALLLGFGVVGVAWAALAATVLNAVIFAVLLRRHFGWPGWQWDSALARSMMRAAFPLMLNSLLMVVFFRFDTFIIRAFHGPRAVAEYGAAYKIPPIALILPPIIVNALFPRFSRQALDDRAGLLRGYRLTLRVLLLLALPLSTVVSALAPVAIRILAPGYGAAAEQALALLIWFVPMSYVNGIAQYVLIAVDRQGQITRAFALTAAFNLVMNLLLVPRWGIAAAALTTVASEFVLYLPFRRVLRDELGSAPLGGLVWRPLLAALAAGSAMLVLGSRPVLAVPVGLGCYVLILWLLGTFTDEDRALLLRLAGRKPG